MCVEGQMLSFSAPVTYYTAIKSSSLGKCDRFLLLIISKIIK